MGRSSNRNEDASTGELNTNPPQSSPTYNYNNPPETPAAASSRAMSESDSMARDIKEGRLSGFVGHGTTLTGETEFQSMLRIDGHLVGTVTSETGTLIIGTNGQVDANISVAAAMISGTVNGDIVASEKIQLGRTARILGNIQTPRLVIEEGAIFEGSCSMLKAREAQEKSTHAPTAPAAQPANKTEDVSSITDAAASDKDESADSAKA